MIITDDVKKVVETSAFIGLTSVSAAGEPHTIALGKAEVDGDNLCLGIFKMAVTQTNLKTNQNVQVIVAVLEGGPKGYRLSGTAVVQDKKIVIAVKKVEALL